MYRAGKGKDAGFRKYSAGAARRSNGHDNLFCANWLGRCFFAVCAGELLERGAPAKEQCPEVRGGVCTTGLDWRDCHDETDFPCCPGWPLRDFISSATPGTS